MGFLAGLARGAAAGAAGSTALSVVSGADAALAARPPSNVPQRVVADLTERADVRGAGRSAERALRMGALGPVAASLTGIVSGAVAGGRAPRGLRPPTAAGGPLLGAAAMLATDGPAALTGVSDPRAWAARDWVSDVPPHLAYGLTTHQTLVALDPDDLVPRPPLRILAQAAALGARPGPGAGSCKILSLMRVVSAPRVGMGSGRVSICSVRAAFVASLRASPRSRSACGAAAWFPVRP